MTSTVIVNSSDFEHRQTALSLHIEHLKNEISKLQRECDEITRNYCILQTNEWFFEEARRLRIEIPTVESTGDSITNTTISNPYTWSTVTMPLF